MRPSFVPFSFIVQFLLIIFYKGIVSCLRFITIRSIYAFYYFFFSFFFFSLFFPSSVGCSLLDPSATPLLFSTPRLHHCSSTDLLALLRTLAHASRVSATNYKVIPRSRVSNTRHLPTRRPSFPYIFHHVAFPTSNDNNNNNSNNRGHN